MLRKELISTSINNLLPKCEELFRSEEEGYALANKSHIRSKKDMSMENVTKDKNRIINELKELEKAKENIKRQILIKDFIVTNAIAKPIPYNLVLYHIHYRNSIKYYSYLHRYLFIEHKRIF